MSLLKKIWRPLIALLFLIVLVKKGPIKIEQLQLVLTQPKILILGLVIFSLQFLLFALRWKIFVDQFSKLPFKSALRLTLIGQFFSFFIPGGVGGDVVKALELSKDHVASKSTALSTVIADRVLGLYTMILMSSIFLAFEYFVSPDEKIIRYLLISLFLFVGLTVGLLFSPFVIKKINQVSDQNNSKVLHYLNKLLSSLTLTFESFRTPSLMIKNSSLCFVVQFLAIFFMFTVVKYLGIQPPPFFVFFALCCFGLLASAIPLTPAGIGVGQAAFYFIFSPFGSEMAEASVTALSLFQLFQLVASMSGGILFALKPTPLPAHVSPNKGSHEEIQEI